MLIEFLNDYYAADFKKIHDIAGNQHLVGHSVRFDKDLFVKIFTESENVLCRTKRQSGLLSGDIS